MVLEFVLGKLYGVEKQTIVTCSTKKSSNLWLSRLRLRLSLCSDNALIRAESAEMILDWRAEIMPLLDPLISLFHAVRAHRMAILSRDCTRAVVSQGLISFPFRRNPWWVAPIRARQILPSHPYSPIQVDDDLSSLGLLAHIDSPQCWPERLEWASLNCIVQLDTVEYV